MLPKIETDAFLQAMYDNRNGYPIERYAHDAHTAIKDYCDAIKNSKDKLTWCEAAVLTQAMEILKIRSE